MIRGRLETLRRSGVAIAVTVALIAPAACLAQASDAGPNGSDGVAAELMAICRTLRDGNQYYYGEAPRKRLEAQLADASDDDVNLVGLRGLLAQEQLKHGEPAAAVALLEQALTDADALDLPDAQRKVVLWNLALAHLQAGEDANCVTHHGATSCVLPLDAAARHRQPHHARSAARHLVAYLRLDPQSVLAAWLLNLAQQVAGVPASAVPEAFRLPRDAFAAEVSVPGWIDRAPALGVDVVDLAGGAVVDDFDGDGWLDLVTSTSDPCDHPKAFRNDGRGGFEDVSVRWGLASQLGGGLNLIHGDYDGDGRLDLYVLRGAWLEGDGHIRNSLLHNRLDTLGRFVDVTHATGLAEPAMPSIAAAWADADLDGDLDLFVASESGANGRPLRSLLYRNDGPAAGGAGPVTFTEIGVAAGVGAPGHAKGVAWGDYDDDGDPDLFVAHRGPNRLYRNDGIDERGQLRFAEVSAEVGMPAEALGSFASWFFDPDNDGDLDLFVATYDTVASAVAAPYFGLAASPRPAQLWRNDGGRFVDVAADAGLLRPQLPMGANHGDVDNDGWPDVYLGTGDPDFSTLVPNALYRNRGDGRYQEITMASRLGHLQKGHGVAFGDVDGDGDQDLFHQLGGFFPGDAFGNALFENPGGDNHWLTLRLEGRRANRFGVGARVEAVVRTAESERSQRLHQLVGAGGSFGGSSMQVEMGLGLASVVETLVVRWPGGARQSFHDVDVDRVYRLVEGADRLVEVPARRFHFGRHPP